MSLLTLTRDATDVVSFDTTTIKGVEYARFEALAGSYVASYLTDTSAPTVTAVFPSDGAANAPADSNVRATFSEAMDPATINGSTFVLRDASNNAVSAVVTYEPASRSAILDPDGLLSAGATYTATVVGGLADPRALDLLGNPLDSNRTWTFSVSSATLIPNVVGLSAAAAAQSIVSAGFSVGTSTLQSSGTVPAGIVISQTPTGGSTAAGGTPVNLVVSSGDNCPCSAWDGTQVPAIVTESDTGSVELGVKFRTDVDGFITSIRFYKGPQNLGTHIGNLWTSSGQLLASATFTSETASGWQQVDFAAPVAVTANTVYVASYFAPQGRYSADIDYFAQRGC